MPASKILPGSDFFSLLFLCCWFCDEDAGTGCFGPLLNLKGKYKTTAYTPSFEPVEIDYVSVSMLEWLGC